MDIFNKNLLPNPEIYYKKENFSLKGSNEWRSDKCPFHQDNTPSFSINIKTGGFFCHACGAKGGDILDFHQKKYTLDFKQALHQLIPDFKFTDIPIKKESIDFIKNLILKKIKSNPELIGKKKLSLYPYYDKNGKLLFVKTRVDYSKGKWIRSYSLDKKNQLQAQEPVFKNKKPLYNLLKILSDKENKSILIVEGEKCVEHANIFKNIIATTSGSESSARSSDWTILKNKTCFIWPDNDKKGLKYAEIIFKKLIKLNCNIKCIDPTELNLKKGDDIEEWISLTQFKSNYLDFSQFKIIEFDIKKKLPENKISPSIKLIESIKEKIILFHDPNKNCYALIKNTQKIYDLDEKEFKGWLTNFFYEENKKILSDQYLKDSLKILKYKAENESDCKKIYIRVAQIDNEIYIDLCKKNNQKCIKITQNKWNIIDSPPIIFLRPEKSNQLPNPIDNKNFNDFWNYTNFSKKDRILIQAWMAYFFIINEPRPILQLIGMQGSAKSTTQNIICSLLDPKEIHNHSNNENLYSLPQKQDDRILFASHHSLLSWENVSYLSSSIQDDLCKIATGATFSKRVLYTVKDIIEINVKKSIVINSINNVLTRSDVLSRTITIELPVIKHRKDVTLLKKEFEKNKSFLFGALLNIVSNTLKELPNIYTKENDEIIYKSICDNRLIEFIRFGMAMMESHQKNSKFEFLELYNENRKESIEFAEQSSPLITEIIKWVYRKKFSEGKNPEWYKQYPFEFMINMNDFLEELNMQRSCLNCKDWPTTSNQLINEITRHYLTLKTNNITFSKVEKRINKKRFWKIKEIPFV